MTLSLLEGAQDYRFELVLIIFPVELEGGQEELSIFQRLKLWIFSDIGCNHHKQTIGTDPSFKIRAEPPLSQQVLKRQYTHMDLRIPIHP